MKAMIAAMPALQAQEDIRLAAAIAAGSGTLKPSAAREWHRERRRAATAGRTRRERNRGPGLAELAPEEAMQRLAALGIEIEYVSKVEEQSDG